jgi:hypothetical protein
LVNKVNLPYLFYAFYIYFVNIYICQKRTVRFCVLIFPFLPWFTRCYIYFVNIYATNEQWTGLDLAILALVYKVKLTFFYFVSSPSISRLSMYAIKAHRVFLATVASLCQKNRVGN